MAPFRRLNTRQEFFDVIGKRKINMIHEALKERRIEIKAIQTVNHDIENFITGVPVKLTWRWGVN